ncbi:hypothetical protein O181_083390 [Austropuccinia psidii MF-1]|uniref:Uncharacterized protein n=1 Tax=Austropuccinia psidii MF-1 TaxID=1389203 RepID=A0A9Q3FN20_9BASI|nr:hypothetical protein [Austropuccinia psidii MF-1]
MLVILSNKHTRNAFLLSNPSGHAARGVPAQDTLASTPLCSTMMKAFPSGKGGQDLKQAGSNASTSLSLTPQVLIFPTPLLGHHSMVTSLLDWSEVIIQSMKDGNGKRTFELGPIVTIYSRLPIEKNPLNPLQEDTPIPRMTQEKNLQQPTPGLSGTRCSEDFFRIPSHEDKDLTCEAEPEEAPAQSMEEPFAHRTTPPSVIIINDTPIGSPPPSTSAVVTSLEIPPIAAHNTTASSPAAQSSPQSEDEAQQEFTDLCPTLMIL